MKTSLIALSAAVLASVAVVAPASAQDLRVTVGYSDLDIHSEAGAAVLASRIDARASLACARASDVRNLKAVTLCRQDLIANAVDQLNTQGATQAAGILATKG